MAWPTIACLPTASYIWPTGTPLTPTQFNYIEIRNVSGTLLKSYYCDAAMSGFLPTNTGWSLLAADHATLYPLLVGLLVTGFIVRLLRHQVFV